MFHVTDTSTWGSGATNESHVGEKERERVSGGKQHTNTPPVSKTTNAQYQHKRSNKIQPFGHVMWVPSVHDVILKHPRDVTLGPTPGNVAVRHHIRKYHHATRNSLTWGGRGRGWLGGEAGVGGGGGGEGEGGERGRWGLSYGQPRF